MNNRLKESLSKGRDLQTENQRLRDKLGDYSTRSDQLGRELYYIKAGITEAIQVLQSGPSLRSEGRITLYIPKDNRSARANSD